VASVDALDDVEWDWEDKPERTAPSASSMSRVYAHLLHLGSRAVGGGSLAMVQVIGRRVLGRTQAQNVPAYCSVCRWPHSNPSAGAHARRSQTDRRAGGATARRSTPTPVRPAVVCLFVAARLSGNRLSGNSLSGNARRSTPTPVRPAVVCLFVAARRPPARTARTSRLHVPCGASVQASGHDGVSRSAAGRAAVPHTTHRRRACVRGMERTTY
jgi:hypothetical protein